MNLITGGTGFVGGAIVHELLKRGEPVRVLARPTSNTTGLESLGVEITRGDILDRDSLVRAMDGCRTVYHAAAVYETWTRDVDAMKRSAVEGTRNAMEAALTTGVERVVYTSTAATIGERRGEIGNEQTAHRGYFLAPYEEAKYEAARVVRSLVERGCPIVSIAPAGVLGPGDLKATGQGIVEVINGQQPALFPGTLSYVDIDDVAVGHVLAASKPAGEVYILAAGIASIREIFGGACELAGAKTPPFIPIFVAQLYARIEEFRARLTGNRPGLARASVEILAHGLRVDGSKAARELGISYKPLEESLRRAIQWYWDQGLLKREPACVA